MSKNVGMKTPIQELKLYLNDDLQTSIHNNEMEKAAYIKDIIEVIELKFSNQEKMAFVHAYEAGLVDPKYAHGLSYFYKVYDKNK